MTYLARVAAGPLALVGFFLHWTNGAGVLSGESYSGYDLVRLAGLLQRLDLPADKAATLYVVRGLLIVLPIAAAWLTLLAPAQRQHWAYATASGYVVIAAAVVAGVGFGLTGALVPAPGVALLLAAAVALLAPHVRHRGWRRSVV